MLKRISASRATSEGPQKVTYKRASLRKFKRADLEVSDKIGKGAYGGVWQATVLDTRQEVVVKVVWPDADLDPEDAKKESPGQHRKDAFKREIEMMRRVGQHQNIIAVLGATPDSTVIVFEEALTDLHVIIKKQKRSLSLPIIRRCIRDILSGVEYLHSIRVVHRDLKPANILVFKDMTCKLGDFGLAREFGESGEMTVKNEVSTLWYRAPELIMGCVQYTPIIDEWSCGCILIEMLTGRCQLMGRVEDVCNCPSATHFNYNSDQLLKTFHLVGSPTDEALLSKMHCLKHFQNWPKHKPTLEHLVRSMLTPGRFKDKASIGDQEIQERGNQWVQVANALLQLSPKKRITATQAIEMPLFQDSDSKPTSPHGGKDASSLFQRVQSVPAQSSPNPNAVGASTDGEEGDGAEGSAEKTRGYGNGNKDGSLGREVLKPSKKLVLHPFKRMTLEQEQSAAGGGGTGVGITRDSIEGSKMKVSNAGALRRPSLDTHSSSYPSAPQHNFGALRRVISGGDGGAGIAIGRGIKASGCITRVHSAHRTQSVSKQFPAGNSSDSCYDLIG